LGGFAVQTPLDRRQGLNTLCGISVLPLNYFPLWKLRSFAFGFSEGRLNIQTSCRFYIYSPQQQKKADAILSLFTSNISEINWLRELNLFCGVSVSPHKPFLHLLFPQFFMLYYCFVRKSSATKKVSVFF